MIDNNSVCYQGVQRIFRNAVVDFLRTRMPLAYPSDHLDQLKRPFAKEWEKAASSAEQSRLLWGTSTLIKDDYDLLGINHFFNLFDAHFDKLFSTAGGHPGHIPRPVKARLLGNLKTIKDSRDPISHPVAEEVAYDEAFGLLIDASQVLVQLALTREAAEVSTLAEQLDGGEKQVPTAVRNLPTQDSIYLEFVGRSTLLQELKGCFESPDSKRCLLAGDGGKGKSAVAYRFAQEIALAPGRFKLIIWLSAKRRKLQEGKVVGISSPDFTTAEDAVNRLLGEYGGTDVELQKSLADRKRLLIEFLNELPAFVIADDIDSVLEDPEVVEFFTFDIPRTSSAVLLTSRRNIPGVRSFVVKGFGGAEAEEFIRSRLILYGLDRNLFTKTIISEITRVTDGSPLYIDDLLRVTKVMPVSKALKVWSEKKGEEARKYALQSEMEQLSGDAKSVLVAAAISNSPISFAELETILQYSEDRLHSALDALQTLFLFPKPQLVQNEQRFEINLNTKQLVRSTENQSDLYARIERASLALSGKLGNVGKGNIGSLIRQAQLRLNAGREDEAEAILLAAIDKYPHPDLHSFLAYAYKRLGRTADARKHFESAHKLKSARADMFLQWINMEMTAKEWSKAIVVSDKALKAIPDFYEMAERRVFAKLQAGLDFHRGLHREKAQGMWKEAVHDFKIAIRAADVLTQGQRKINASLYYHVIVCLDMLGEYRERDRQLEQWAAEHPDDPRVERQRDYLIRKHGGLTATSRL